MNTQEFNNLKKKVQRELERYPILAYYNGEYAYCLDCFERVVLGNDSRLVSQLYLDILDNKVMDNEYVYDVITDNTVQFEEFPGQIIPLEGVTCCRCDSELVEAYEELLEDYNSRGDYENE